MNTAVSTAKLQERQIVEGWGLKALEMIKKHGLNPTPQNYSVWYEYARGANKKLIEEINQRIQENKPFTLEITNSLYEKFVLGGIDTEAVAEATSRTEKIMEGILKTISSSSAETKNYNKELDSFSTTLTSGGDLQNVVGDILKQTQELKKKGEELTKRLNDSQTEVELLKGNLQEAKTQMNQDALTGLQNRKAFDEAMLSFMAESREHDKPMCLLMIDVDHFKKFNDTYGHLLGDQVLRIVASAMRDVVKGRDFVARYGGEEFAIILPETPINGAKIVAENVRQAIAARELKRKDSGESYGKITVSIGVSSLKSAKDKPEDLISRADAALYKSKHAGRNLVTLEG